MPDAKRAAAYIRVSTEDQMEYSPDAQLAEIRKYAAAHDYVLPNAFIFVDEGISGKTIGKRPEFNRMIGTAKQKPKPFDAILLWKFSRFARNREDSIVYKSMLRRELGINVVSISEPLTDDKMSVIMEAMIEAMDEYYSINLAEEVKRGMTEKARRGGLQSAPAFGYRVEHNVLTPIPEEAALVRAIFHRFISGEGLFPIAKWMNDMGVTTHRGGRFENRTVEYILRNPVYIGKLRWNPAGHTCRDFTNEHIILADARHEPLISQETWDAAQRRMGEVKAQRKYHGRPITSHRDWLSGLVRCFACGSTLVFAKPRYWKCNGYARGGCNVSQHVTDGRLKGMLLACLDHDQETDTPISYRIAHTKPERLDELSLLQEREKQIAAKLSRLREAYLAGVEDLERYGTAKAALEVQAAALTDQIKSLKARQDVKAPDALMKENTRRCAAVLLDSCVDMPTKHRVAHDVMEKCVYDKSSNALQVFYLLSAPK